MERIRECQWSCLVRWANMQKSKRLGGLDVLDLERLGRAIQLRWLWYQWTEPDRPWVGTEVPCNDVDKQLFRASTQVVVGNVKRALFWESSWIDGKASQDLAPQLYKLAWRKNQSIKEDLHNYNWTRGLWRMSSATEMVEFVYLWTLVSEVQLFEEEDTIRWKWTVHGPTCSAYAAQHVRSFCSFDSMAIWKAKTKGKHRFSLGYWYKTRS